MEAQPMPFRHTCIDAGVDWITATCKLGATTRVAFEELGEAIIEGERAAGVEIKPAALRDYRGFRASGIFSGRRSEDSILVLSGSHAPPHFARVAQLATNVSRLDLQATVWTHGETPALSRWYYARATRQKPARGRPRSYSLIRTHPYGDTLYVGKRQSDYFGRCYDYATAHKKGEPRTLWRFEVECKRQVASSYTRTLSGYSPVRAAVEQAVHRWFGSRGLLPTWDCTEFLLSEEPARTGQDRATLEWFRRSLSKTVAREIGRHGLPAVLDALRLSQIVIPLPRKEDSAYDNEPARAVSLESYRRPARATDRDGLSLQRPYRK
jgi:hypothetical protein